MDKLKLVKSAVFILTFMLVFGTLLFLGALFKKTHKTSAEIPSRISLNQPRGSIIQQISQNDGTLYMLIQGGGEDDRIIIFDTNTVKKVTTLTLN